MLWPRQVFEKNTQRAFMAFKLQVKHVTMDMWRPYPGAVNAVLPHAIIAIDKFHVVKMANEAVERA